MDLSLTESHDPAAAAAWLTEAYIPYIDGYVDMEPAEQYGLAVGDLLAGGPRFT